MGADQVSPANTDKTTASADDPRLQTLRNTAAAFQDSIIGKRLPAWLLKVPVDQMIVLGEALSKSLEYRQQLARMLARVDSIDDFVASALQTELDERYAPGYNVRRLRFLQGHGEPIINAQPVGSHLTKVVYEEKPLLEVAMRNFTAKQAKADGQPSGNRLLISRQGKRPAPTAIEFAALCRELDLGEHDQRHLSAVLNPSDDPKGVESLLVDAYRYAMAVDAYQARFTGILDDSELQLVLGMSFEGKTRRLAGDLVVAKQLRLVGCMLEQIVVLEVIDQGPLFNTTRQILLYIPGDPYGAWSKFSSLTRMSRALGQRFRSNAYLQFFRRFVRLRDSQAFFSVIIPAYADLPVWASFDLQEYLEPYPVPLFNSLARARIRQIKDDAALIATPVAQLDREIQRMHDQRLAAEGWTLVNIAGLFVPEIGIVLLAVTAWELLGEVYHGIETWREGDTSEALEHLHNVAVDLATIAATAVGVTAVRRIWNRSVLVDNLVPARLEDGSTKLWRQDLMPFRSSITPSEAAVDAQGIQHLHGQSWIEMDGHTYPVIRPGPHRPWQLRPIDGHGPQLQSNGAGAWRLWHEQPAEWDDRFHLFRRLGGNFTGLDDEQIDQVLSCHGLEADHLRALHVSDKPALAGLLDSVLRCRLDARIRRLVGHLRSGKKVEDITVLQHAQRLTGASGLSDQALAELAWSERRQLFQRLYDAMQATQSPASSALRRVFPSLHQPAADELIEAAISNDRRRLLESGRIPLRLAEAARASSLAIRAVRGYEAFYLDTPQTADLARIALGMFKHLAGAAPRLRWRLFEGDVHGPLLLATEEGGQTVDLAHVSGRFLRLNAQGQADGVAGELFEVMASARTAQQWASMGIGEPFSHNLRVLLARQAVQRREEVAQLFTRVQRSGTFRPPQRLADGRLGYLMGGCTPSGLCGRDRSMPAMLRELFPTFTDEQVIAWVENVLQSGRRPEIVMASLRAELADLNSCLDNWVMEGDVELAAERVFVRRTLLNGWRRRTAAPYDTSQPNANFHMMLYGAKPEGLPQLPARVSFGHISNLALLHMDLEEIPTSFLLAFSRLRVLDLGDNHLTRLPQLLLQMQHLRSLVLTNNQIVLDRAQASVLASCEGLEYIDLSHNPLGRTFTLSGMSRLRWLNLRATRISQLPSALTDRPMMYYADLRDNRITHLPEQFYQAPLQVRRRIRLAGNSFGTAEVLRLQRALMAPMEPIDAEAAGEQSINARELWGDAVGPDYRGSMVSRWDAIEQRPQSERFFQVLRQLLHSADFHRRPHPVALRVLALLQLMTDNQVLCDELLSVANDEWGCQDGATWCLSNLELKVLVWNARNNIQGDPESALLDLGKRLWRLDEVDRLAVQDIVARAGNPDESEVGLAYRLGLRERLNLPLEVGDMSFRPIAGVDETRLEQAHMQVLEAETQERLARSLVERDFWQAHLERARADEFSRMDEPFHERLEALLDDQALSDQDKKLQSDAIREEQLAARRGLMLEMTIRALEEGPADPPIHVR
ncbi:NEL-type E3 ubiquitin ligase domain-containing protein [Pseudomonas sp. BT-42-2]|uniref:NEL-type E3 ubiquitin ligase domain-containing protein n=1 Tax=Pseudomonas sp. BT-42-2 TaxID=2986927 RepID=UPI0021F6FA87|nr:NEL-type E3 ubiquitin ligase domain-containing protein [Pseudomonas sp. BT-42-2]MCV9920398.1 NEL-type E3 ubiquitin ligase domain-containing protein [Pseudomonas sp. BT-42-2]